MTQPNAYLQALEAICRWTFPERLQHEAEEIENPTSSFIPTLCETILSWSRAMSEAALHKCFQAQADTDGEVMKEWLSGIKDRYGEQVGETIHQLHEALSTRLQTMSEFEGDTLVGILPQVVDQLHADYESNLDHGLAPARTPIPQIGLGTAQRQIGRLVIDRLLGVTGGGQPSWDKDEGREGISVLNLAQEEWSLSDRIHLSSLMIDGLSALHDLRLDPNEGFDPTRMRLNAQFEINISRGAPSEERALFSPERYSKESGGSPSDVWALGQLLISLYTAQPCGEVTLNDEVISEILPGEVLRVLERCLHPDPTERLYSAKEVRVVMKGPMERWLDRLSYEKQKQVSGESEALPYEEVTAQREERDVVKAKRRRLRELNLRRGLQWRATKRQALVLTIFSLILVVIYVQFALNRAGEIAQREARISQILRYDQALDIDNESYQSQVPDPLKTIGFKWRYVLGDKELPSHLISKTEVTHAQYRACVDADACEPLIPQTGCVWGVEGHESDPINCLSFHQARAFAEYVGGALPTVEQWMWSATRDGAHEYPWGRGKISSEHANLDFDHQSWERGVRPVCQFRFGDSTRGLCDLVGSMAEWVVISETGEIGGYYQLRAGVMGGGWLTPPELVDLNRPIPMEAKKARYDVGVRVVKAF